MCAPDYMGAVLTQVATRRTILKAAGSLEAAEIARTVVALEERLLSLHNGAARKAVAAGAAVARRMGGERGVVAVNAAARRAYNAAFVDKATGALQKDIATFYALGKLGAARLAGTHKAKSPAVARMEASFTQKDIEAVKALKRQQVFWIGDHYDTNLSDRVRSVASRTMVEDGLTGEAAGKQMDAMLRGEFGLADPATTRPPGLTVPSGFRGSPAAYMRGLATHVSTTGRVAGTVSALSEIGVQEVEISNPMDSRTCDRCRLMNGKRFKLGQAQSQLGKLLAAKTPDAVRQAQPWLKASRYKALTSGPGHISAADSARLASAGIALPPYHLYCFPGDTKIQGAITGGSRAWYEGETLELLTREGRRLAVTPNHPILSARGFIPAGQLSEGDQLVCYRSEPGVELLDPRAENDEHQQPSRAEDVFRALAEHGGALLVSPAPDDFHGEAARFHGDVEVVGSYRDLLADIEPASAQQEGNLVLEVPPARELLCGRAGALDLLVERMAPTACSLPGRAALPLDGSPVALEGAPLYGLRIGLASQLDTRVPKGAAERGAAGAGTVGGIQFVRELLQRHAAEVSLDEIVEIRVMSFAGHVFDFQAVTGYIVAQDILISNCRCTLDVVSPGA